MIDLTNYKKEKLTFSIIKANVVGLLLILPILVIFVLPFYLKWSFDTNAHSVIDSSFSNAGGLKPIIVIGTILMSILIHELLHGIFWAYFANRGFKSIKFGVLWKMLTPYCHCKEPLKVKQYINGAVAPGIILGLIPSVIALIVGSRILLAFWIFMNIAAVGDLMIYNLIRKEEGDAFVQDHPSEVGCYIYRKNDEKEV